MMKHEFLFVGLLGLIVGALWSISYDLRLISESIQSHPAAIEVQNERD